MEQIKIDKALFSGSQYKDHIQFWKQMLLLAEQPYQFPKHTLLRAGDGKNGATKTLVKRTLEQSTYNIIKTIAGNDPRACYVIVLAACQVLLSRYAEGRCIIRSPLYSSKEKVVAGHTELILALDISALRSFKEVILKTKENVMNSFAFQSYPLSLLGPAAPVYNLTNVLCYSPSIHNPIDENSQFDLLFEIEQRETDISIKALYSSYMYEESLIKNFLETVEWIVSKSNDEKLNLENLLVPRGLEAELIQQLPITLHSEDSIASIIDRHSKIHPEKCAIIFNNRNWTYGEINLKIKKLASHLRTRMNIKEGDRVAVMMKRSERLIIGLLAILKCGAAYIPIDESQPEARLEIILEETSPKVMLIDSESMHQIRAYNGDVFVMDLQLDDETFKNDEDFDFSISKEQTAYVIYTSGSTGKPKGVLVKHEGMLNTLCWRRGFYGFQTSDISLQFFAPFFDGSVTDIFTALISGGTLVMPPDDKKSDARFLAKMIKQYGVTNFITVPSFYKILVSELAELNTTSLKFVTLAGENPDIKLIEEHYRQFPNVDLYNEYGPTENSVCSTASVLKIGEEITIGKPIANVSAYVLDKDMRLVQAGAIGELFLGGCGLATGYLNRDELTAEKFVKNPFDYSDILYRTGDLAARLADGRLKYLGRIDTQVKYRGFRIELEEIESVLKTHAFVKNAVVEVIIDEQSDSSLVAFVIADDRFNEVEIRTFLNERLIAFMLPDKFIALEEFPTTTTGKIDRKKLKEFNNQLESSISVYVEPTNEIEKVLAEIWQHVLGIESVGIRDNFFFLGGHSLKATQITSQIYKRLNIEIDVKAIFNNQTIEELAKIVGMAEEVDNNEDLRSIGDRL